MVWQYARKLFEPELADTSQELSFVRYALEETTFQLDVQLEYTKAGSWTDILHDHIECRHTVRSYEEQRLRVGSRVDITDFAGGY